MNQLRNIAEALGVDNLDLAGCCRSSNINQWSFHKPVNSPGIQALSEEDFYRLNSGFYLYSVNQPQEMLYFLMHRETNILWTYEDRIAPYRLSDFFQYEHYGDMDFSLSFTTAAQGRPGDTLRVECGYNIWDFVQWGVFNEISLNNLDIILLFYPLGTDFDGGDRGVYLYKVCSYSEYDEHINLKIPNDLSNGDYELRLCFSTATGSLSDGQCIYYRADNYNYIVGRWYALPPDSKCTFSVGSSTPPTPTTDFFGLVDFEFDGCNFNYWFPTISDLEFFNYVTLLDDTRTAYINIVYKYLNCPQPITLREVNIQLQQGHTTETVWVGSKDEITVISDARLDEGIISIEVTASIRIQNTIQTRTWTVPLEKA
jgi:hypothetical protein